MKYRVSTEKENQLRRAENIQVQHFIQNEWLLHNGQQPSVDRDG